MTKDELRQESNKWLGELGFTELKSYTGGGIVGIIYHHFENPHYPVIDCFYDAYHGEKYCKVYDSTYPMFLTLSSGRIQYKHPHIMDYVLKCEEISRKVKSE